jgi:hypothetical protein
MRRAFLATTLAVLFLLASPAEAQTPTDPGPFTIVPNGAVGGGDAAYLPQGAVVNVWDVHGGTIDHPNLDLGAGGDGIYAPRGAVVINHDVGKCFVVENGHKQKLLSVCGPTRKQRSRGKIGTIKFHVKPTVVR